MHKSTQLTKFILKQLQFFKNRKIILLDSHIPLHRKVIGINPAYQIEHLQAAFDIK